MSRSQRWILGCALGCFAAGMTTGLVLPDVWAAVRGPASTDDPDETYASRLALDYGLDEAQRRTVLVVLRAGHEEELAVFRRAEFAQLPASLQAELKQVRRQQVQRIRYVLDPTQRARYDADVRGGSRDQDQDRPLERGKDEVKNG